MGINIIVVTGLTGQGENDTVGRLIAKWLRCPSVFLEPIVKGLRQTLSVSAEVDDDRDHEHLLSTALDVLFQQASYLAPCLLDDPKGGCIVLEFSLSCWSQIRKLIKIVKGDNEGMVDIARVLVIECMLQHRIHREIMFEEKWFPVWYDHHIQTLADAEKLIEQRHQLVNSKFNINRLKLHDDEAAAEGGEPGQLLHNLVSKLEIDMALDYPPAEFAYVAGQGQLGRTSSEDGSRSIVLYSPLFEALEYLLFKHNYEKEGSLFFNMRQWGQIKLAHMNLYPIVPDENSAICFKGLVNHDIILVFGGGGPHPELMTRADQDDIDEFKHSSAVAAPSSSSTSSCRLCEKLVVDSTDSNSYYYRCRSCPLYLHKACAELLDDQTTTLMPYQFQPIQRRPSGDNKYGYKLSGPTYTCRSCGEAQKGSSMGCKACLFDTILKNRLRPIIIRHPFFPTEEEFLQIQIASVYEEEEEEEASNICAACLGTINHGISYIHNLSSMVYGFPCVTQSLVPVEQHGKNHFGYRHPLRLRTMPHEELDYYVCHICWKERDGQSWYYYCDECQYTVHIKCICGVSQIRDIH